MLEQRPEARPALVELCQALQRSSDVRGELSGLLRTLDAEDPAATATFEVKEAAAGVDYKKGVTLPDTEEIPIPELDWQIPGLPVGAQANIAVKMTGDLENLVLALGLDACITVPIVGTSCGADLPIPGFPLYLVQGTFDFSSLCAAVVEK